MMQQMSILVLGNYGYKTGQLDGQTIKTRTIYSLLDSQLQSNEKLYFFDTQDFKYSKKSIFLLLKKVFKCDKLVYLPAQNSLKYIFPFLFLFSLCAKYDILYVVIGGWLSEFLQKKYIHVYMLSKIKAIFLENKIVELELIEKYEFSNTHILPNFRLYEDMPFCPSSTEKLNLVFMSRITMNKGLDIISSVAAYLNKKYSSEQIKLDFYGQINPEDKSFFEEKIMKFNFVSYKGALEPSKIYATLSKYDALLLPTKYKTEGFPGAILDAYISGIPVIVSNWKCSSEFVKDKVTGYICDLDHIEEFCHAIDGLYNDRKLLLQMKYNSYLKSKDYCSEKVWESLSFYLN